MNDNDLRQSILQDMHERMETLAEEKIEGWKKLPVGDPTRILLEAVAEYSADLYVNLRPSVERLIDLLPDYFKMNKQRPPLVSGVIEVRLRPDATETVVLPRGTEFFGQDKNRRFVSTKDTPLTAMGTWQCYDEGSHIYFNMKGVGPNAPIRCFLSNWPMPWKGKDGIHVEEKVSEDWQPVTIDTVEEMAGGLLVAFTPETLSPASDGYFHFRIQKLPETLEGSGPELGPALSLNPVRIEEEMLLGDMDVAPCLGLRGEMHHLPVFPKNSNFELEFIGSEETWKPVASLNTCGPKDDVFTFNAGLNAISFGDGKHGRVPPHRGQMIRLKNIRTNGAGERISPQFISEFRSDIPELEEVSQPYSLLPDATHETEAQRFKRFLAHVHTHERAITLGDYEHLARILDPSVALALAKADPEKPTDITVYVAGGFDEQEGVSKAFDGIQQTALAERLHEHSAIQHMVQVKSARPKKVRLEFRARLARNDTTEKMDRSEVSTRIDMQLNKTFSPQFRGKLGERVSRKDLRLALEDLDEMEWVEEVRLVDAENGALLDVLDPGPTGYLEFTTAMEEI